MATTKTPPATLVEALRYFKDPDTCLAFLSDLRWPGGQVACPRCGSTNVGFLSTRRLWECKEKPKHARAQFSIKVGTIFEDSPISLDKWLAAVWLIANAKNGISSYELHRDLGVTQKSAWFMLHRIRLAMQAGSIEKLGGPGKTVEVDESWIGGAARSMNKKQLAKTKTPAKGGPTAYRGKAIVQGILERGGRVRTEVVADVKKRSLIPPIRQHVVYGSEVFTDSHTAYLGLQAPITAMDPESLEIPAERVGEPMYEHQMVDHQAREYVRGNVHTNGIENFWSLLKRTIRGTYVSVEPFHLFRYLDEQSFRFNERKRNDAGRFVEVLRQVVGRHLTYQQVTGKAFAAEAV